MSLPMASDVARQFGKQELLAFCDELEIEIESSTHIYDMVQTLVDDIDSKGVPMKEDVTERLFDFLVFMKYYTQDGKFVENLDDVNEIDAILSLEGEDEEELPSELPECFGWGEPETNGNCKKCPIQLRCVERRGELLSQMDCYVQRMYDSESKACSECTMWRVCKQHSDGKE